MIMVNELSSIPVYIYGITFRFDDHGAGSSTTGRKCPAETGSFTAADGVQLFYSKQGSGHDFVTGGHGSSVKR
jgi:hypothetical protein